MKASTWKGGTYGVRVGKPNAQTYFDKYWDSIEDKIKGEFNVFKLSKTFWTTCPEFRGNPIPSWLMKNGLDKWPKGSPHVLQLIPLSGNKFELLVGD